MEEKDSLSSDLDLIKELEELKLKQKILISSLKKPHKDILEIHLLDLNKKVDFLVKIFKDSDSSKEDEEEKNVQLTQHNEIIEKMDKIVLDFNEKFENIEKSILEIKSNSNMGKSVEKDSENLNNSTKVEGKKEEPPIPDFNAEISENKIEQKPPEVPKISEIVVKKEKKKWF